MRATARLVARSPWIPIQPTPKQLHFLSLQTTEAFYGGAAGGGKSDALLMDALLFADVPGYKAILLRRTYPELAGLDGLINRSKDWLGPTNAVWSEGHMRWTFPSGAMLRFGHMQREEDKHKYQGDQFQFIGYDELTSFTETQYAYVGHSRLRRLRTSPVPLRIRSASNPGNIGHEWVYERFVVNDLRGTGIGEKPFISAKLDDNPYLSTEEYRLQLQELDDVTRRQLLNGEWVTPYGERPFKRSYWRGKNRFTSEEGERVKNRCVARWIGWDTAAMDKEEAAYTACVVAELDQNYELYIKEVWQGRPEFTELPEIVTQMAYKYNRDSKLRSVIVEEASSGIQVIQVLKATAPLWLRDKLSAMKPLGKEHSHAQAGVWAKRNSIKLPEPGEDVPWLFPFEEQLYKVPNSQFLDMADALGLVVNRAKHMLAEGWRVREGYYTRESVLGAV